MSCGQPAEQVFSLFFCFLLIGRSIVQVIVYPGSSKAVQINKLAPAPLGYFHLCDAMLQTKPVIKALQKTQKFQLENTYILFFLLSTKIINIHRLGTSPSHKRKSMKEKEVEANKE